MRAILSLALLLPLAFVGAAEAQQRKAAPAKPAAAPEPPPVQIFPCRTLEEVCYLGVVVGSQVAVLYTNSPSAQGIDPTPIDVVGTDGQKIDLAKNVGRVVMVTGEFDPKTGIKGEVVEVASPLSSLAIKAQLAGGAEEPPAPPAKGGGKRR